MSHPLPVLRPDLAALGKYARFPAGFLAGQIEVTSRCFQHCVGCDSWREDLKGTSTGEWSLEQLIDVCTALLATGEFEHLSLTGGDPQAWPHLDEFIKWWIAQTALKTRRPKLQLNTALTQDLTEHQMELWSLGVDDLRISLDGVTVETYEKIRGRGLDRRGNCTTPMKVLERMQRLQHPGLTTNTTVFFENIHELRGIYDILNKWKQEKNLQIRKAHFLPAIGGRGHDLRTAHFWENWEQFRTYVLSATGPNTVATSLPENPHAVRQFLASETAAPIKCWAGGISFHIKCDGWMYPCCLVGGEALKTQQQFRMGNVFEESLEDIRLRYEATAHYADPSKPCREICQWKQTQVNVAGHLANATFLAMP